MLCKHCGGRGVVDTQAGNVRQPSDHRQPHSNSPRCLHAVVFTPLSSPRCLRARQSRPFDRMHTMDLALMAIAPSCESTWPHTRPKMGCDTRPRTSISPPLEPMPILALRCPCCGGHGVHHAHARHGQHVHAHTRWVPLGGGRSVTWLSCRAGEGVRCVAALASCSMATHVVPRARHDAHAYHQCEHMPEPSRCQGAGHHVRQHVETIRIPAGTANRHVQR